MPETVKAVTGLNLEYSRFSLPNKTNPISVASVTDPDCNCSPSDPIYQFPANWDTGPEQLDVFFYPRNYSGSDLLLFTGNQGLSRNIVPSYPTSFAYVDEEVNNPYTPITLTKTENVFADHPDIPKKRVSATTNTDLSYAVFYDTHLNISRKCWAGTGNLGGDEVLVIYSYSKQGLSIVLCYMNGASTECIHSNDEASGPHSVLLDLTPGTHFGSKSTFNIIESFFYNDSYYYSLDMGSILTYYTFTNSFNGYFNGWYGWASNYGLDSVYSGYYGYNNYVNNNYYYYHKQTSYAPYVKDAPLEGTSNWLCLSGRPQSVYHNIMDTNIPNWRQTTEEEREEAISSFGTGIDYFNYITMYWSTVGAVDAVPAGYVTYCNQTTPSLFRSEIPACPADTEPDWENPFVTFYEDSEGNITYNLSPILAGYNWYYSNYYGWNGNGYLKPASTTYCNIGVSQIGNPTQDSDCYYYQNYNFYWGWSFNGNGPYSNGSWIINPDVPGAIAYACGTPVNEVELDDGTTSYSVMELLSVNSVDVSWPRFVPDEATQQTNINNYCNNTVPPCGFGTGPYYKSVSPVTSKYTKAVYKVSSINLPINLGVPYWTRITDDEQEEFPLATVNKEYVTEPGYLRSTYYGSIEARAKAVGRSNYNYFGNSCYSYGYDSVKYEVYPSTSSGGSEEEPADELVISNCNEYSNPYYNWYSASQRYLNLKFKSAYIPYFFGGVRPSGGLVYPANLTEPKVRIFSTDPPNPEEFRDSNYPKYYFQEFDPSVIMISESKLLEVPPVTVTTPPTPNTKIYLPDYENAITKTTILPRATTMLQTVAEQTEYFQCEYLKGEFNDWYYYFPPSFLTSADIDERLDFPEDIYDCKNEITPTIPPIIKAAFLFDPNKGEEQLRSAGTSFNYYNYYNNLSISYLDYPEITAAIYTYQREVADEGNNNSYPVYLPGYVHVMGNQIYDLDYIPSSFNMAGTCNYIYGITSIVMGGTDLCSPITLSNGNLSSCGINLKKVEPTYSVMSGYAFYDALDASRTAATDAYESDLSRAAFHSHPITSEYKYVSSYTTSGSAQTGWICTPNYSSINYTWHAVMVDQASFGVYYGGYGNAGFTKSYYDITLPVWGRVSGLYYYGGYYNYWNPYGWPYNTVGGDTSFLDCDMIVADMGYTARKQELTGNNLSNSYYSTSLYSYNGGGVTKNWNISDIGGYASLVSFTDTGNLVKQESPDPENCGKGCKTPTISHDSFYFDLVPVGGNFFFRGYGYGYYGYASWWTGEVYCQTPNTGSGGCTTATESVRLSPEFPELPPYNNNACNPEDYFWVEPCTRFTS
jgi:hypothetical protein